jgi:plant G-box-binding factor
MSQAAKNASLLSLLDGPLKNANVSELAKAGIEVEGLSDNMDANEREKVLRIHRRKLANRESAKRSKIRKKIEDAKLLDTTKTLLDDQKSMRQTIKDLQKKVDLLHAENVKLKMKLAEKGAAESELTVTEVALEPVNLPPEVETPSLVIKDSRKKRKGMLKSRSDSSIATTFDEAPKQLQIFPAVNESKMPQAPRDSGLGKLSIPAHAKVDSDFVVGNFFGSMEAMRRSDSPFFTDNLSMYDFQYGELVDNVQNDGDDFFF